MHALVASKVKQKKGIQIVLNWYFSLSVKCIGLFACGIRSLNLTTLMNFKIHFFSVISDYPNANSFFFLPQNNGESIWYSCSGLDFDMCSLC